MRVQILHVPECPNTPVLAERLNHVLPATARVEQCDVHDHDEAASLGMAGSPTLLIDGVDPFAAPGQVPSLTCRLYLDEHGTRSGAPSVRQLRAALRIRAGG